ncbi:MAG: twin-arginine translocation protein TatB subunit [Xanthobacteraceae bacterium]|jgi:sec-independent protein translocase protein TatB|nr:twin-arginine translocation protein TatB subunit [Xanthobacteraceae bacterium]
MFDIGWSELLVIGIVALVVIGPKELPGVLRSVGQMVGKLRRMAGEFQGQFQEALREAELDSLKKGFTDFTEDANKSIAGALPSNPLLDLENEVKAARDAIEGRKDEPATTVEEATAKAAGLDPATPQISAPDAATAAVEAQLPKPEEPLPLEPYAFEDIVPGVAGATALAKPERRPEPLPAAETKPVEAKPLDAKPLDAKPLDAKPLDDKPLDDKPAEPVVSDAKPDAAAPKRKPRVTEPDAVAARTAIEGAPADLFAADLSQATPAKPGRKPRVATAPAEPGLSDAAAALDDPATAADKPKRKPRVRVKSPSAGDEGPDAA